MKLAISALMFFMTAITSAGATGYVDGWKVFVDPLRERSTWAAYYRDHARVSLGREQRLPNGVAWRLHTDIATGLAFPRLTWLPQVQSLRVANDLLELAHSGALFDAHANERRLQEINARRREYGWGPLTFSRAIEQTDIGLTYASDRLVSVIDLGLVKNEGNREGRIIRGLTFDLDRKTINRVKACPNSEAPYGWNSDLTKGNFQFVFGELLRVCSEGAYRDFVHLLLAHAERAAQSAAGSKDFYVTNCIDHYTGKEKMIGEHQEVVLYLTFDGLAVFNTDFWPAAAQITCASKRSAINPVIIPYAELKPFMIEGAWRDELLALPAPRR